METLGLSESTPRSESRLKALFWPSIQTGSDVDYLGAQGYWLCTAVAVLSCVLSVATSHPIVGVVVLLFYYLGGVGVRQRSHYAAAMVFVLFLLDTLIAGPGVFRVLMAALLLSNVRATWIAADWKPDAEEAILPPRLSDTWSDKFVDKLPEWIWPKVRIPYYIYSAGVLILTAVGLAFMMLHRAFM
jgi:hypothetical protein